MQVACPGAPPDIGPGEASLFLELLVGDAFESAVDDRLAYAHDTLDGIADIMEYRPPRQHAGEVPYLEALGRRHRPARGAMSTPSGQRLGRAGGAGGQRDPVRIGRSRIG